MREMLITAVCLIRRRRCSDRATTGLTPMFSGFCPQLISASRFCVKIPANLIIPKDRGAGVAMQTMKIPNWIALTSTSIRFFERIIFGQRFTASPWGADRLVCELRNLSPAPGNQN
jgi:hypothetical protein